MAGSIDSVPSEFAASLREAGIDNLLEFLSHKSDSELRLRVNEQRGEAELSSSQKLILLRSKLETSPGAFLFQFGKHMEPSHLDCFNSIRHRHYDVDFYLGQMEKSSHRRSLEIKNRRYEALQKLVDSSDYFSEEEMQRRNPILYSELIGRFHTAAEREAFLFQSSKSSSAIGQPSSRPTPLTDTLIAHMNRRDGICSDRRIEQEMQVQEEKQALRVYSGHRQKSNLVQSKSNDEESDDDEEEVMDEGEEEEMIEIDEAEKELLKEEFFTTMYRHFLEGKDEDFDYETVDQNQEYDLGETLDQDEEEKYFDAEEVDEGGGLDQSIASIHIDTVTTPDTPISNQNPISSSIDVDTEEDELDSYMREIEAQVQRQKSFNSQTKSTDE